VRFQCSGAARTRPGVSLAVPRHEFQGSHAWRVASLRSIKTVVLGVEGCAFLGFKIETWDPPVHAGAQKCVPEENAPPGNVRVAQG
jgi:hypothetical protein